jgi:CheY-like chemotaxis protein
MSKILIMEDSIVQAMMLADWLELDGHDTKVTHNAADALTQLTSREHYDLLITDVFGDEVSGEMPGAILIQDIRSHDDMRLRNLPIISVSGLSFETKSYDQLGPSSVGKSRSIASDAHFLKPVNMLKLSQTINELIASRPL